MVICSYATNAASQEMPALAVALLTDAGYGRKNSTLDKELFASAKPDPQRLSATVSGIVNAMAAGDVSHAPSAAVELLLQVFSEGLTSQHATSSNGARKLDKMPPALTGLAAEFLGDADPFVHGMAEWAVTVNVCNDNDEGGKGRVWPGEDPPVWYARWAAIPASQHVELDYVRQAICLGMHRRGHDLLRLSEDVMRRAEEKAAWAKLEPQALDARRLESALAEMHVAYNALAAKVAGGADLTSQREAWLSWRRTVRDVVLTGPDLDFDRLVYLKRFSGAHHLQPGTHSAHYPDGGGIHVQTGLRPDSPVEPILQDKFGAGYAQDLDLWWDADRIVFARTDERGLQKLYEVGLDGEGLHKLTDGPFDDVDPAYMPDGSVVFGSTRGEVGIMCASSLANDSGLGKFGRWSGAHTNIFLLSADRDQVRRISYCKDDDAYP
jgi:hypothetical protein